MPSARPSATIVRRSTEWGVLASVWVLFLGVQPSELAVGAAAAGVATAALEVVELHRLAPWRPRARWLLQVAWLPYYATTGTWRVFIVLARQLFGVEPAASQVFASPYDATGRDEPSATKRALATACTSVTPTSVVVDVDVERDFLLVHQIDDSPTSKMTLGLGAKA